MPLTSRMANVRGKDGLFYVLHEDEFLLRLEQQLSHIPDLLTWWRQLHEEHPLRRLPTCPRTADVRLQVDLSLGWIADAKNGLSPTKMALECYPDLKGSHDD